MTQRVAPELTFSPLPWQVEPWRDTAPVMLLTGSAGGGKSRLAAEKLHGFCLHYPGAMALAVRKIRQSMTNSTVLFLEHAVIGKNNQLVRHFPSKRRFEYRNGSMLVYGGMANQEQREQIRSIGKDGSLDIVWMEEANGFQESDFNEIIARMRGKTAAWRQIELTTNPDTPSHWIYKRLIKGGQAHVYYSGATDNYHNPDDYITSLESLTGVQYKRLVKGQWIQAEGAVYDGFRHELHVVEPFAIPREWRRFRAVDFGYTNPFVCQWWAIDGDGRLYLYREMYRTQTLVEDAARQIVELSQGERIETTICDHDAEDRATLEHHGVPTKPAQKAVSVGIQAVQARLRKAGDGRPRLFLFSDALIEPDAKLEAKRKPLCALDEFPGYIWQETRDGRPNKEEPVKDNDHSMDALRYAIMYVDNAPVKKKAGPWRPKGL